MTAPWAETTLPTILSRYPLKDIFNADEVGLFYQCLPDRSYHLKGEKCSGGKHSKTRLTGLAAGNPFGERLLMFVIWKSKMPRCFKCVKHLPSGTESRLKVGCLQSSLRNGSENLTGNLASRKGKSQ